MRMLALLFITLLGGAYGLYSSTDDVVSLTQASFDRLVKNSDEVWLVEFYAPWCGHCQTLAPEWKNAATALKGVVKVGAVNCDSENALAGQYGIQGFPTVKIFVPGKSTPEDYKGARNAQALVDAALNEARTLANNRLRGARTESEEDTSPSEVIELTDANFDSLVGASEDLWLIEFFAPWCGHCKALAPQWEKVAKELKGRVKVAAVDATVHQRLSDRFSIRGYPTIKTIPAGKKGDLVQSAVDYEGGRTASDIVAWAEDQLAANAPVPPVLEVTDTQMLKDACEVKQLCVIAVLPSLLDCDAQCRNRYLALLADMAAKHKRSLWSWLWTEASAYTALERSIGIGGFAYPSLAALNIRKQKYVLLRRAFSTDGLTDFFRELSIGRGITEPYQSETVPQIESREPWNGLDAQVQLEVEDVDVSDVELDEEPEEAAGWKMRRKVVDDEL